MTVSIMEAKQNLETLLHKMAAGENVVITLENQEFEVTAKKKKLRGALGSLKGWKMSDDFNEPLEDMKEYME
jgi:antitoxin (DNA-binding transcriptional repressor) of toxin-antitoxin stability system